VLDLRTHGESWVRERLADNVLGFDDRELASLLERGGLSDVRVRVGARLDGDPFTVLIACGTKPLAVDRSLSPVDRTASTRDASRVNSLRVRRAGA
jgi:hypothetical protein